jgi:hypothetical protein
MKMFHKCEKLLIVEFHNVVDKKKVSPEVIGE